MERKLVCETCIRCKKGQDQWFCKLNPDHKEILSPAFHWCCQGIWFTRFVPWGEWRLRRWWEIIEEHREYQVGTYQA